MPACKASVELTFSLVFAFVVWLMRLCLMRVVFFIWISSSFDTSSSYQSAANFKNGCAQGSRNHTEGPKDFRWCGRGYCVTSLFKVYGPVSLCFSQNNRTQDTCALMTQSKILHKKHASRLVSNVWVMTMKCWLRYECGMQLGRGVGFLNV